MAKSTLGTFMSEAEKVLRKYADQNPNLAVWRCKQPLSLYPGREVEMILVGMPDEKEPSKPTSLIVFRTWLDGRSASIEFTNGEDSESRFTPFGGGWVPIEELEKLAKKLPDL